MEACARVGACASACCVCDRVPVRVCARVCACACVELDSIASNHVSLPYAKSKRVSYSTSCAIHAQQRQMRGRMHLQSDGKLEGDMIPYAERGILGMKLLLNLLMVK